MIGMTSSGRASLSVALALFCSTGAAAQPSPGEAQQESSSVAIDEILVVARNAAEDPTRISPDAAALIRLPGEINDPIRALLALPGITFGRGDMDDPVMRGAGPRDNLFLVDGIPLSGQFHELSDSIVDPKVVRSFDLQTAALSPGYGNAVGGALEVGLRDPLTDDRTAQIDLSQLKSGLLLEGPIGGNVSAYVTYRENLAHLFLSNLQRSDALLVYKMPRSRDYAARVQWRLGESDLTATVLGAWDRRREEENPDLHGPGLFGQTETRYEHAQSLRLRAPVGSDLGLESTLSHIARKQTVREVIGDHHAFKVDSWAARTKLTLDRGISTIEFGANLRRDDASIEFQGVERLCDFLDRRCGAIPAAQPTRVSGRFDTVEGFARAQIPLGGGLRADLGAQIAYDNASRRTVVEPRLGLEYRASDALDFYARVSRQHERPELDRLLLLRRAVPTAPGQPLLSSTQALVGQKWQFGGGWRIGAKWRGQSGTPYTPLASVSTDPVTGQRVATFGKPFDARLGFYNRLDLRVEKQARFGFGDATFYVDVLNATDSSNTADRSYPLRNLYTRPDGSSSIAPDDELGIPLFVAVGVRLTL